jgi:hypothetical protein
MGSRIPDSVVEWLVSLGSRPDLEGETVVPAFEALRRYSSLSSDELAALALGLRTRLAERLACMSGGPWRRLHARLSTTTE